MKTAIVTGASGFIGKKLVNYLISQSIDVYAVVKDLNSNVEGLSLQAKILYANDQNFSSLSQIKPNTIDTFYHLAWDGTTGIDRRDYKKQVNSMQYTLNLYKVANEIGCKRFISTGTISERLVEEIDKSKKYNPNLTYAIAKHATYLMLSAASSDMNTPFVWAQLSNLYGENNNTGNLVSYTLKMLFEEKDPEYSLALQPYDLMDVGDAVRALYLLGMSEALHHQRYFIGSGKPRILKEYLLDISKLFDNVIMKFGAKPEDGYIYKWEWFDTVDLINDTGFEVSESFTNHMSRLVKHMRGK